MKFFNKKDTQKKVTTKLPMTGKVRTGFRRYCVAVLALTMVLGTSMTAFAANDPIQVVNNLSDFIFGLVRAVGMIMLGFGIVQVGLSLKSHDPSQKGDFDPHHRLIPHIQRTKDRAYRADHFMGCPICPILTRRWSNV